MAGIEKKKLKKEAETKIFSAGQKLVNILSVINVFINTYIVNLLSYRLTVAKYRVLKYFTTYLLYSIFR